MATDYAAEALNAYNDIQADGVALIVRSHTFTSYDPKTDGMTGATIAATDTYCIVTAFKDSYNGNVRDMGQGENKTVIKMGDRMLLVPAYGLPDIANPDAGQTYDLVFASNVHQIVSVETIEPGGIAILYRVHARR